MGQVRVDGQKRIQAAIAWSNHAVQINCTDLYHDGLYKPSLEFVFQKSILVYLCICFVTILLEAGMHITSSST